MRSALADDPYIGQLFEDFLERLAQTTSMMADAFAKADWPGLTRLAHSLKGAGGSYGYPVLTSCAARLERAAKAQDHSQIAHSLQELQSVVDAVLRGRSVCV